MTNTCKIFGLLLYKNLIVRKRYWRLTIFLQILVPVGLFALLQAVRDFSVQPPTVYNESLHYDMQTKEDLIKNKVNNAIHHVYYVPKNVYTDEIMENARYCLYLLPQSNCLIQILM
jgi:hypothetical protein